ncbi:MULTISPECIES: MDR family MFS transporter [Microbacterium]|uniref:MFS transporter, DHA2 family, lincomycin resistance protein n=1 Tax=Microbacterium saccharophilum TaxID=1213358 RepID=A0A7Z7CX01_9MICO|nr:MULTISPECIES: MDR family MFS transporter [Microbacterium]SFI37223.1 MFS transporter, DHA2 family, lincomycin resistance protein [Microbacterium saccharophilum]
MTPPHEGPTAELEEELALAAKADEPERVEKRRIAKVIGVLALSAFVMILNETVLGVALPVIMDDFAIAASSAQWLTTGFLLTMAIVIPTTGFLIQRFTTRSLFVVAVGMFLVGTLVGALAPTFIVLLVARIVQAAGTAIIMPLLMTTTLTSVAPRYRGTVMGLNSVVISVAPAIGPTLSGIVIHSFGWRAVFGFMLPVIAILFLVGVVAIRTNHETRRPSFDVASVILSAFAFGGIVYGLASIESLITHGAWQPIVAFVVGIAALLVFVVRQVSLQRTRDAALLDLRPFTVRNFRLSVFIVMIAFGTMLGTVTVLPIYLQKGLGISALATGLVLLPGGVIQGVLSPVIGRVYDKIGPLPLVIPGAVLLAAGQWALTTLGDATPLGVVIAMHLVFCAGMALIMTPLMTLSLSALNPRLYAHGSAIMNTLQQLAGAAGTAALVAALTIGAAAAAGDEVATGIAEVVGTQHAFVVGAIIASVAVVAALFVRRTPVQHR